MSTSAQITANQTNALLSTGPRTEEGKARSSQNALQHGLRSRQALVFPGEEPEYHRLRAGLQADLQPAGELETVLFDQIVHASWNMRRCRLAETGFLHQASGPALDPLLDDVGDARLRRIDQYARRAERAFYHAIKELRAIQTERQYRREMQPPASVAEGDLNIHTQSALIDYQVVDARLVGFDRTQEQKKRNEAHAAIAEALTIPAEWRSAQDATAAR